MRHLYYFDCQSSDDFKSAVLTGELYVDNISAAWRQIESHLTAGEWACCVRRGNRWLKSQDAEPFATNRLRRTVNVLSLAVIRRALTGRLVFAVCPRNRLCAGVCRRWITWMRCLAS